MSKAGPMPTDHEVTRLLQAWSQGSDEALDDLLPLVFEDLHRMARYFFQRENVGHTLQPTALVGELYLRLRGKHNMDWDNRADFFHFAAEVMRHILVDHARSRKARKRGGGTPPIPLDSLELPVEEDLDLVALSLALEELEKFDYRQSQVVMLRFFVGLKVEEIAEVLEVSPITVKRDWRTARFWLHRQLKTSKDATLEELDRGGSGTARDDSPV